MNESCKYCGCTKVTGESMSEHTHTIHYECGGYKQFHNGNFIQFYLNCSSYKLSSSRTKKIDSILDTKKRADFCINQ